MKLTYTEFVQQAVLAQMQGHPVLGTTYMESTCEKMVENAIKIADRLEEGNWFTDAHEEPEGAF